VAAEQQQQQQGMTAWMPETMGADMNFASHKSRTVICSAARCEILLATSAWKRRVNEAILSSAGSQSTRSRVVIPEPKFFRSFLFDEGDLDAMNAFQGSQLIISDPNSKACHLSMASPQAQVQL
jgi:hypothetical protein